MYYEMNQRPSHFYYAGDTNIVPVNMSVADLMKQNESLSVPAEQEVHPITSELISSDGQSIERTTF